MISATEAKIMANDVNSVKNAEIVKDLDKLIRKAAENGATSITYYKSLPPAVRGALTDLKYTIAEYPGDPRDRADDGYFTISW